MSMTPEQVAEGVNYCGPLQDVVGVGKTTFIYGFDFAKCSQILRDWQTANIAALAAAQSVIATQRQALDTIWNNSVGAVADCARKAIDAAKEFDQT